MLDASQHVAMTATLEDTPRMATEDASRHTITSSSSDDVRKGSTTVIQLELVDTVVCILDQFHAAEARAKLPQNDLEPTVEQGIFYLGNRISATDSALTWPSWIKHNHLSSFFTSSPISFSLLLTLSS